MKKKLKPCSVHLRVIIGLGLGSHSTRRSDHLSNCKLGTCYHALANMIFAGAGIHVL